MPYTKKQHAAAGAELARRRQGKPQGKSGIAGMSTADLRHMASKASGTRKKGSK